MALIADVTLTPVAMSADWVYKFPRRFTDNSETGVSFKTHGGVINCVVKINGIPQADIVCTLFLSASNQKLASKKSDALGQVQFDGLSTASDDTFFIIAETDLDYNTLIFDKLHAV